MQPTILYWKPLNHILWMRTLVNRCVDGQTSISINPTGFCHHWITVHIAIKLFNRYYKLLLIRLIMMPFILDGTQGAAEV